MPTPPVPTRDSKWILVAVGGNLGNPAAQVRQALGWLKERAGTECRTSPLYRSRPRDCPPGSPDFINAAAAWPQGIEDDAEALLAILLDWETRCGPRPRRYPNEPRFLDLDLIAFGPLIHNTSKLVLPHPRALERRFVLQPLVDIVPSFVFPGDGRSVAECLAGLADTEKWVRLDP